MSAKSVQLITIRNNATPFISILGTIVSLLLIVAGAFGLLLIQEPFQQTTQDVRSRASVPNGQVELTTTYNASTNSDHALNILADTNTQNVERFELVLNVITGTFSDAPRIVLAPNTNLQLTRTEIEKTSDGFLISIIAVPQFQGNAFNSSGTTNGDKNLIQLQFYPVREGAITISIDSEKSVAKIAGTNLTQDQLRPFATASYSISRSSSLSSGKACNEQCTGNAQCASNYRCFDSRCRLATNPSNTSCDAPADNGLQRSCNQYCADSRECGGGLTCFYNQCRQPGNVDSISCAKTTAVIQQQVAQNCNQGCSSNANCANNMRCFQGACRLATNPSSSSCSAPTLKSVSAVYYPTISGPTKGQEAVVPPVATSSTQTRPGSSTAFGSLATTNPTSTPTPLIVVSPSPLASFAPVASPVIKPLPRPNTGLPGLFSNLFTQGLTLPLLALIAGLFLLLLVILLTVINLARRNKRGSGSITAVTKTQPYEANLQNRINELRQQPPATEKPVIAPLTAVSTTSPTAPVPAAGLQTGFNRPPTTLNMPGRPIAMAPTSGSVSAPIPTRPPAYAATPASAPGTSMMDRLKQKGISTPQQPTDNG